jgi:hypothetical protein
MTSYVLSFAFVVITAILLWILIGAKGSWKAKLALIALVPAYGLLILRDADTHAGWPTSKTPPEESVLVWGVIHEPGDLGKGDPGCIYVWLIPMDGSGADEPKGTPRAFRLPYSRGLHEAVQGGMERAKEGRPGVLKRGQRGGHGHGRGEPNGARGRRGGRGDEGDEYHSYDLPPPAVRKDHRQ